MKVKFDTKDFYAVYYLWQSFLIDHSETTEGEQEILNRVSELMTRMEKRLARG